MHNFPCPQLFGSGAHRTQRQHSQSLLEAPCVLLLPPSLYTQRYLIPPTQHSPPLTRVYCGPHEPVLPPSKRRRQRTTSCSHRGLGSQLDEGALESAAVRHVFTIYFLTERPDPEYRGYFFQEFYTSDFHRAYHSSMRVFLLYQKSCIAGCKKITRCIHTYVHTMLS